MTRRIALAAACAALALWSLRAPRTVAAQDLPLYAIDDLGSLGGFFNGPADINDAGDVVGTATTSANEFHAFVFTDAAGLRDLNAFFGTTKSQAFGINNHGHVSGFATRTDGSASGFLYGDDIGAIDIGGLPGGGFVTVAADVNDRDQVTGFSWADAVGNAHAIVWSRRRACAISGR